MALVELVFFGVIVEAAFWLLDHALLGSTEAPLEGRAAQASLLLWFLWNTHQMGRKGQSLGGRLLGLKVVNEEGSPIGFWRAFIRNILAIATSAPLLLWLWIAWDPNRQALHDKLVRSYVIRTGRPAFRLWGGSIE